MNIKSVNIGQPEPLTFEGETIRTGIFKRPVETPVHLGASGFEGDAQADRKNHGGADKAACVYCYDHYAYWEAKLNRPLEPGTFGENLTVSGAVETEVCIGDVFRVGGAVVQVSQPRQPCHKLAKKLGVLAFSDWVIEAGFTGFYFRVLEEGTVAPDDEVMPEARDAGGCTVDFSNGLMYHRRDDREGIRKLLDVEALSDAWQRTFEARLRR